MAELRQENASLTEPEIIHTFNDEISTLTQNVRESLILAALRIAIEEVQISINQIKDYNLDLTQHLQQLADNYDYEQIITLLKEAE